MTKYYKYNELFVRISDNSAMIVSDGTGEDAEIITYFKKPMDVSEEHIEISKEEFDEAFNNMLKLINES